MSIPKRIAFYGLIYGGKTAMRVPPLVTDYCLSICSADFNEWVDKNASTRNPHSYVWTGEYEIFEFDLGSTFNYAEMAALIAPAAVHGRTRPLDGVADDWTVAYEFAKVRYLYGRAAETRRPHARSSGSTARTRSTARGPSISCTITSTGRNQRIKSRLAEIYSVRRAATGLRGVSNL